MAAALDTLSRLVEVDFPGCSHRIRWLVLSAVWGLVLIRVDHHFFGVGTFFFFASKGNRRFLELVPLFVWGFKGKPKGTPPWWRVS